MPNILLGVTGGIAAYKAADLAGALVKESTVAGPYQVQVIMTENAKKFITPLTLSTMSRNPVYDDASEWSADGRIKHIELAKWCDLFVIVPATANTISKLAHGVADNLLTSTYLALSNFCEWKPGCVVKSALICPAMNTRMWEAEQTKSNLKLIAIDRSLGTLILPPEEGMLACGDTGVGKLPSVRKIVEEIKKFKI